MLRVLEGKYQRILETVKYVESTHPLVPAL